MAVHSRAFFYLQIQDQPRSANYVTLHFDRQLAPSDDTKTEGSAATKESTRPSPFYIEDQGAWSSMGRRSAQEDAFLLTQVQAGNDRSILLAGVFDGHLGTAASSFLQQELPTFFSDELQRDPEASLSTLLEQAWETTCQAYRAGCSGGSESSEPTECVAEYDAREGILKANTASETAVAGSTAVLTAIDAASGQLSVLNCGDSRGVVFNLGDKSKLVLATTDHKPETDADRLYEGETTLGYSTPQCRLSRWFLLVGEYEYVVSRSLEGPFATSKGITSEADVTDLTSSELSSSQTVLLLASDGLWEVIDTAEVGQILRGLQTQSSTAADAAQTLTSLALQKGSADNVSVLTIFLKTTTT